MRLSEPVISDEERKLQQRVAQLEAEVQRFRSAALSAEHRAERAKATLSFQLGHALVTAGKSLEGFQELPATLWGLRRQAKAGLFGGKARASTELGAHGVSAERLQLEVETLFWERGPETAHRHLVTFRGRSAPGPLAGVYTRLAKLCLNTDSELALRIAQEATEIDPRSFRVKWFALLTFEAGHITDAARLLAELPRNEPMSSSERAKVARIRSAHRLLREGFNVPKRREKAQWRGPMLYITASALPYHVTGYTSRSHSLLRALRETGVDLVCLSRPGYPGDRTDSLQARKQDRVDIEGIQYETLPGADRRKVAADVYFRESAAAIAKRARQLSARAIHAASNYENALPALLAARELGLPFVYEVRGLWEYTAASKNPAWEATDGFALDRALETLVAREADAVLTLTAALKDELILRGVPAEKISLAPNAIDPARFVPQPRDAALAQDLGLKSDAYVVGYLGSVVGYEGLDDLARAFSVLRQRVPKAQLLIVGNGDALPPLELLAGQLTLGESVTFTGRVAPADVQRYYSLFDVIVLPRKPYKVCQLVSPLKPLEAMAMAIPTVVSDVAALKEMVEDNVTGRVFPAGQIDALAAVLEELANSEAMRKRLGETASARVKQQNTWSAVAKHIEQVHRGL